MNTVTIQNKKFKLFEQKCLMNGCTECIPHARYIDIQVFVTNTCNAKCEFCCNPNRKTAPFDYDAFTTFFDEVYNKISINKITFTGGEAGLYPAFTDSLIKYVHDKCNNIVINTNGTLDIDIFTKYPKVNVALSRHHYNNKRNNSIFGIELPNIIGFLRPNQIHFSCNLIKGQIDSVNEMCEYMELAGKRDVSSVSFVGLMPINQFCIDNHVDPFSLDLNRPEILKFRSFEFPVQNKCKCMNYIYVTSTGKFVYFYLRKNLDVCYNKGGLLIWKNNKLGDSYGM